MSNSVKVSILIPIYNVGKYIERCIYSLMDQTMQEGIEYIFTDDGSSDNSLEILDRILKQYPHRSNQVKILQHPTNLGLAEARVTGVKNASGEYLIHCDSDDWIEPDMVQLMYDKAKEIDADIVGCNFFEEYKKKSVSKQQPFTLSQDRIIEEMLKGGDIGGYLWSRMFKTSFYKKYKLRAPKGTTLFEDLYITIPAHYYAKNVGYINKELYHYNQLDLSSITKTVNIRNINSGLKAYQFLQDFFQDKGLLSKFSQYLEEGRLLISMQYIFKTTVYSPDLWRELKISSFTSLPLIKRISATLVYKHYDRVNFIYVNLLRWLYHKYIMLKFG